jgi:hypothetical protein
MFELHVVVAGIVMFNILELIMKIVPNYPTPVPSGARGGCCAVRQRRRQLPLRRCLLAHVTLDKQFDPSDLKSVHVHLREE